MISILGFIFIVLFFALIVGRVILARMHGLNILVLGKKDKRELIFWVFYLILLYIIAANCFNLPMIKSVNTLFWNNDAIRIFGVILCSLGILGFIICMVVFGNSVRIGIDHENAGKLTTTGIYAYSRNPMYLSFQLLFLGEFFIFPNIGLVAVCIVAFITFHITILKEEAFLKQHYGDDYKAYCKKVRRYL